MDEAKKKSEIVMKLGGKLTFTTKLNYYFMA